MLTGRDVVVLLDELCLRLGFCLRRDQYQRLAADPPPNAREFVDEVFRCEGLDPEAADRHLYRQVRDIVVKAYRDSSWDG